MSYKIAVASSDEKQVDETFGAARRFMIYEVTDGFYQKLEERVFDAEGAEKDREALAKGAQPSDSCVPGSGCGGQSGGCGAQGEVSEKVKLVSDCRCIVCKKIGFHIQKQLERKAISAFDVNCTVEEALEKISHYFKRIDNHESLRAQR